MTISIMTRRAQRPFEWHSKLARPQINRTLALCFDCDITRAFMCGGRGPSAVPKGAKIDNWAILKRLDFFLFYFYISLFLSAFTLQFLQRISCRPWTLFCFQVKHINLEKIKIFAKNTIVRQKYPTKILIQLTQNKISPIGRSELC